MIFNSHGFQVVRSRVWKEREEFLRRHCRGRLRGVGLEILEIHECECQVEGAGQSTLYSV